MPTFECTTIVTDDEGNTDKCGTLIEFAEDLRGIAQRRTCPKCGPRWIRAGNADRTGYVVLRDDA